MPRQGFHAGWRDLRLGHQAGQIRFFCWFSCSLRRGASVEASQHLWTGLEESSASVSLWGAPAVCLWAVRALGSAALPCYTPEARGSPRLCPPRAIPALLGDRAELAALHESLSHMSPDLGQGWRAQLGPSKAWSAPASDPCIPFPGPEQPQPVRHWRCADWPILFCYPRSCQRPGQRHHDTGESGSGPSLGLCSLMCQDNLVVKLC